MTAPSASKRWRLIDKTGEVDTPGTRFWLSVVTAVMAIAVISPELDAATLAVILALISAGIAAFAPAGLFKKLGENAAKRMLTASLAIGAAINAAQSWAVNPALTPLWLLVGLAAVLVIWAPTKRARALFAVVVIAYVIIAGAALAFRPVSVIDVHQFQQEGSAALLAGENPYGLRFLNVYGPDTPYYSPEVIDGDRVNFGFPYLPAGLLLAVPGYALLGDYRWAALAAVVGAALLIGTARRTPVAMGAALVFMTAPVTQDVLWRGWSEPFGAVTLAAVVWLAGRSAIGTAVALGLFVAVKQYLAPALLIGAVLLASVRRQLGALSMVMIASVVSLATILPFILWDPASFIYSTVTFHGLQPFRDDALSLPAMAARNGLPYSESELPGLVAGALATIFVVFRSPRTVAGFCSGLVVFLLVFFLFGKQAFINYYFLAMAAAACGIGALQAASDVRGRK